MNNKLYNLIKSSKVWEKGFENSDDLLDNGILKSDILPIEGKVFISLIRTNNIFEEIISKKLRKINLSMIQVNILEMLYFSQKDYLSQDKISNMVFSSKANISTVLSRMEVNKLITRENNTNNKREKRVKITTDGMNKLIQFFSIHENSNEIKFLDKKNSLQLIKNLSLLRANLKNCHNLGGIK